MFERTEDQSALADAVAEFCNELMGSTLKEDDENELFRREFITAMGEQGFLVFKPRRNWWFGLGALRVRCCT